MTSNTPTRPHHPENVRWAQARMMLDDQLMQAVRYSFSLIAFGFGSFLFLQRETGTLAGESTTATPSRAFSLAAIGIGIAILIVAIRHARNMATWVNIEEFPDGNVPPLPDEQLPERLAIFAVLVGVCAMVGIFLMR